MPSSTCSPPHLLHKEEEPHLPDMSVCRTMVVVGIFVLTIASTFVGIVMLRSHAATVEAQKSNSTHKRT